MLNHSRFEDLGSGLDIFLGFIKNAGMVAIKAIPLICNIVVQVKMSFIVVNFANRTPVVTQM